MADVLIIGGGPTGLTAAMKLASHGMSVAVLERDPSPMPTSAEEAWARWERRAVAQFRQVHYLQPGGRAALAEHCPTVIDELLGLGAIRLHPDVIFCAPDPPAELDPHYETVTTCRRPVLELGFARAAAATPGVEIRRGAVVEGLVAGAEVKPGVPHVTGVRLAGGEVLSADLVIDAGGRRSAVGSMIETIGGRLPEPSSTEVGFTYTSRFYRGELPEYRSDMLSPLGSISLLTVHGDDDTWATTLYAHPADKPLRRVRDPQVFERVVRLLPDHAHWVDGEPISEPESMTSTANTIRPFVVDGVPAATGVVPLGDAFAFTNPSIGRGIGIGVMHAIDVVDAVASLLGSPLAVAKAWQEATDRRVRGFVESTIQYDLVRGPEVEAAVRGEVYEHTDPVAQISVALDAARHRDQEVFESWRDISTLNASVAEVISRPGLVERVLQFGAEPWTPARPTREELLDAVS